MREEEDGETEIVPWLREETSALVHRWAELEVAVKMGMFVM